MSRNLKDILEDIGKLEMELRDILVDKVDAAEEVNARLGGRWDDMVEQEDGTEVGVLYFENVAPHIDMAVHNLFEAGQELQQGMDEDE